MDRWMIKSIFIETASCNKDRRTVTSKQQDEQGFVQHLSISLMIQIVMRISKNEFL